VFENPAFRPDCVIDIALPEGWVGDGAIKTSGGTSGNSPSTRPSTSYRCARAPPGRGSGSARTPTLSKFGGAGLQTGCCASRRSRPACFCAVRPEMREPVAGIGHCGAGTTHPIEPRLVRHDECRSLTEFTLVANR